METTAINSVYVVMSMNIKTHEVYCLQVFGSMIDAKKYKKELYEYDEEGYTIYYILEKIVY